MNLSDLYAICCLLVWGGTIGFAVAMLCQGKSNHSTDKTFPSGAFLAALIVGILLQMILQVGNPNYLSYFLWFFASLLAVTGLITRRFRMQRAGTIFITVGTIFLYFFFTNSGYTSGSDGRLEAQLILFTNTLADTAKKDKNIYPTGILNDRHPALTANVELAEAMKNLTRIPLWHTAFTDLYKNAPLPLFEFQAGTIADNQEALLKHARQEHKGGNAMRPVRRMLYRISRYAIPITVILGLLMIGAILLRKRRKYRRKYRKEFLRRPRLDDEEYLHEGNFASDSVDAKIALALRQIIAEKAKIPPDVITLDLLWHDIYSLPHIDELTFDAVGIIMELEAKLQISISDESLERCVFDPSLAAYAKEKTLFDFVNVLAKAITEAKK